jgi:glutathione-dependent peroxiredoxin
MMEKMKIQIYSKPNCVYCTKAKALVKGLNLEYEELMFGKDFNSPEELYEAIGKKVRTMPQIKIEGELIGGYNQLIEYFVEKGKVNYQGQIINE